MLENDLNRPFSQHPIIVIILVLVTVAVGFILVGPLVGVLASVPFYDGNFLDLAEGIQHPLDNPSIKIPFYIIQGFATLIGFIVGPAILIRSLKGSFTTYTKVNLADYIPLLITPVIVIMFMGFNSLLIEWNTNLSFPTFLKGFEEWAREKENLAEQVTKLMTQFDSTVEFILAVVIIGIIPGIGEELVFRGLIQKELIRASNKPHFAIWTSAILFSAIHMQFFGFFPRLFLGVLFGYLYHWSGSLSISMLAHITNNTFQVIGLYLYQQGAFEFNMEETKSLPWSTIIFSTLLAVSLTYYFKKYYQKHAPPIQL